MSIGVKKQLPYIRFMNYEITKLVGSGAIDVLLKRHASFKQPKCSDEENGHLHQNQKVTLHKVILPFIIMLTGLPIAFVILIVENFGHAYHMK